MARGSAVESAACLDVLVVRKLLTTAEAQEGKDILLVIVSLVSGLITRFSPQVDRVSESCSVYDGGLENE
jgi:hypothetical protein